jgi:hypothetical protein
VKTWMRFVVIFLFAGGVALVTPDAAQADQCSTTKTTPEGSLHYEYCGASYSDHTWVEYAAITFHSDYVFFETQVDLRIGDTQNDTVHHYGPVESWFLRQGQSNLIDPYNGAYDDIKVNKCTAGHYYFPVLRTRVANGSWGPWAGGYAFTC